MIFMIDDQIYHHGILGMKWGVRRYQNKDGSLTNAGKNRYDRDVRENNSKKKDNRIRIDGPDPKRWVKEDLNRARRVVDTSSDLLKQAKNIEQNTRSRHSSNEMNLKNMTNQQLREKIERENLEQQYKRLFNKKEKISKGRRYVEDALEIGGTVLGVGSSALGIALAIKELKG